MLEELKTFIAVVECKNFTKAGEHLNLSQPSVSTHIKHLEHHYGVILIDRSIKQKTIFITENGYKLYKRAKEIVNLLETTYMEVRDISDSIKGRNPNFFPIYNTPTIVIVICSIINKIPLNPNSINLDMLNVAPNKTIEYDNKSVSENLYPF